MALGAFQSVNDGVLEQPSSRVCINETLREDELRTVLAKLESDKDKEVFGLVCKKWLNLQSTERKKLCARAGPHMLKKMAARFTRLHELDLSQSISRSFYPGVTDSDLSVIASGFSCLRVLNLQKCKGWNVSFDLEVLAICERWLGASLKKGGLLSGLFSMKFRASSFVFWVEEISISRGSFLRVSIKAMNKMLACLMIPWDFEADCIMEANNRACGDAKNRVVLMPKTRGIPSKITGLWLVFWRLEESYCMYLLGIEGGPLDANSVCNKVLFLEAGLLFMGYLITYAKWKCPEDGGLLLLHLSGKVFKVKGRALGRLDRDGPRGSSCLIAKGRTKLLLTIERSKTMGVGKKAFGAVGHWRQCKVHSGLLLEIFVPISPTASRFPDKKPMNFIKGVIFNRLKDFVSLREKIDLRRGGAISRYLLCNLEAGFLNRMSSKQEDALNVIVFERSENMDDNEALLVKNDLHFGFDDLIDNLEGKDLESINGDSRGVESISRVGELFDEKEVKSNAQKL
ncbi:unnamed protein product [Ilex paraguariensis]|uniref:F-box protein n=1 Tax=Ilex paraguariensis TaxID=185542 RepID=A0ABC8R301_9AQUA